VVRTRWWCRSLRGQELCGKEPVATRQPGVEASRRGAVKDDRSGELKEVCRREGERF
jgi:hypothetical protein